MSEMSVMLFQHIASEVETVLCAFCMAVFFRPYTAGCKNMIYRNAAAGYSAFMVLRIMLLLAMLLFLSKKLEKGPLELHTKELWALTLRSVQRTRKMRKNRKKALLTSKKVMKAALRAPRPMQGLSGQGW